MTGDERVDIQTVEEQRRSALRERLIAGYRQTADQDRALAEDWLLAEEEVWAKIEGDCRRRPCGR